jgi:hypothetical protein
MGECEILAQGLYWLFPISLPRFCRSGYTWDDFQQKMASMIGYLLGRRLEMRQASKKAKAA